MISCRNISGLLENDLDQVNQLCDSGNVNLDAILNSKIPLAEKNGIRVDYKAACPANLTVSDIDLCALIGNLIDNAVEACEGLADPYIRLYIGVLKNQLYISVTNATKDTVRKLDSEYITTKRGNHGHGLKRINLVVEKYEGYINRQNEPGVFVTEIMLPLFQFYFVRDENSLQNVNTFCCSRSFLFHLRTFAPHFARIW
ncbi:MAG: ATP-binding protein [Blautia sp.]